MASRNLTEAFIIMRNNAVQSRNIYAEQNSVSDRMALVGPESIGSDGVELRGMNFGSTAPPPWIDALEETQYILSRLRTKVDSLINLQSKQFSRPTLDENSQEERQIEQLTKEIGKGFSSGFRQVQIIKSAAQHDSKKADKQLAVSAVRALSSALQDLGLRYRSAQQDYLQKINSREERNRLFFDDEPFNLMNNKSSSEFWLTEPSNNDSASNSWQGQQHQDSVLLQLDDTEQNVRIAMEREQEVEHIVQSISELHDVFKELAVMVQDQGTVLDRIDYNIEQTEVQVHQGCQQLKKAETYKQKNRKIYCVLIAVGSFMLLIFLYSLFQA
ncbi:syntaxin-16 [Copidosoma floridanum]|uniref:syntaxin-16 n=1 Tax=Copidosoma floridanum TaxID=29053 RepID=UPI0006C9C71D|nr:syntaxin-16 [Copidosoma floridanum]